ncbi:MAG: rhodanese-like domain-containing protein [Bacteroidia bacterium]
MVNTIANKAELTEILSSEGSVLIDLRSKKEFLKGHVPYAIHLDILKVNVEEYFEGRDKSLPVLVYCENGTRSRSMVRLLESMGFNHLFYLANGIHKWDGELDYSR